MFRGYRQRFETACTNPGHKFGRNGIELAETGFDDSLPQRSRADVHGLRIPDQGPGSRGELGGVIEPPEIDMGIEQDSHAPVSKALRTSSGSGASKSSATLIFPCR